MPFHVIDVRLVEGPALQRSSLSLIRRPIIAGIEGERELD
jgi:hypothetical protein